MTQLIQPRISIPAAFVQSADNYEKDALELHKSAAAAGKYSYTSLERPRCTYFGDY